MAESAPGKLELVRKFVNTLDVESPDDELASPDALSRWLVRNGLAETAPRLGPKDVERAAALREALRSLLEQNHDGAAADDGAAAIERLSSSSTLRVSLAGGTASLVPAGEGLDAAIAGLLAIVYEATVEGTWSRLKICPADDCLWAFYDRSRNRSRTWCSMDVCGNRAKVRAHRQRAQAGVSG